MRVVQSVWEHGELWHGVFVRVVVARLARLIGRGVLHTPGLQVAYNWPQTGFDPGE